MSNPNSQPASATLTQTQTYCATQSQQFLDDDYVFQIVSCFPLVYVIFPHFHADCAVNSLPTTEELKALNNKIDGVQIRVLAKIRDIILDLVPQVISTVRPKSLKLTAIRTIQSKRRKSDKVEFKTTRCNSSNLRPLAIKIRLLEMVFHLVYTHSFATKRDLFYKHKDLFGTQAFVDRAITDICALLDFDRHVLNIISCSKGSIFGSITLETDTGIVDCSASPVSITSSFLNAEMSTEAGFILVVEKDTIFQRLIDWKFATHFPDGLLGRGFPDIATRQFLKRLQTLLQIPVFGLVDCDPHGLHILMTYKYGSVRQANRIESGEDVAIVDSIQLIGLKPSHLAEYNVQLNELPFTRVDTNTAALVKRRALELGDQTLFAEASLIAERKVKVELEALVAHSPHFLIQYLRDCQRRMPWILASEDVPKSTPMPRKSFGSQGHLIVENDQLRPCEEIHADVSNAELCVVCDHIGEGWHFGAFVCRPCSAFYRRSIAESKTYKCRKNRNCVVQKTLRNSCRACRMDKCISVGMTQKPKQNSNPSALSSKASPSSSMLTHSPIFISNPVQSLMLDDKFKYLKQLTMFMRNFFGAQRSLYITDHPEMSFADIVSKPIDLEEAIRLDKTRQILIYSTLAEGFPLLASLSEQVRIKFLKEITITVVVFTKISLTVGSFPTDEEKMAFHIGYHVDLGKPEKFFKEKAAHLMHSQMPILTEFRQFASKCVTLNTDEIDLAFLVGIILIHKLKHLAPKLEAVDSYRSDLVNEYHFHLMTKYGSAGTPNRFADMFLFYTDLVDYIGKLKETITVFDLFGPRECTDLRELYCPGDKELPM
ncbi:hypothetical protein FO519_001031 [Halicephalobus sp. NKZ332]|nr:hypothetical protein FO519_001031 [Halicephalobus sp. NKZ332]